MGCSYIKNFIALFLGVIYLPLAMLGSGQLTICIAENGEIQFEYGVEVCDADPASAGFSATADNCGDCTDTQLKAGETLRVKNTVETPQIQNVMLCQIVNQKTASQQTYIEPKSFAPDLARSSILII